MNASATRRALVSVSDKTGLDPFVRGLAELGFEIVSTGGTAAFLKQQGIGVVEVAAVTGFPEILGGRVKTLHPKIHAALLGRPDRPQDAAELQQHGIVPFELVVCNLYPFEQTVADPRVTVEEAVEQIDIGGPSMIRAAAKNFHHVAVVTDPAQYETVLAELREGRLSLERRRALAAAAFARTASYDRAIAQWFAELESAGDTESEAPSFPDPLSLDWQKRRDLRYGENPHQQAALYVDGMDSPHGLASAEFLHGKDPSYNNLLDLDAAVRLVREFDEPAAVVIKHTNPCGCALGETPAEAFAKAYEGDPVSAFGSILGFNREVDAATAEALCEPGRFIEAIAAPGFAEDALELLVTRPKWRNNVRLVKCAATAERPSRRRLDLRSILGGLLVQEADDCPDPQNEWKVATRRPPSDAEARDLAFAWLVAKHVKSNAIVLVRDRAVVGVGAGQMSRLDSVRLAVQKSAGRSVGSVMASDAFFPFRDGIDEAAAAGVSAVIQPGGSRRDEEVLTACEDHGMAMVLTGRRHFRH